MLWGWRVELETWCDSSWNQNPDWSWRKINVSKSWGTCVTSALLFFRTVWSVEAGLLTEQHYHVSDWNASYPTRCVFSGDEAHCGFWESPSCHKINRTSDYYYYRFTYVEPNQTSQSSFSAVKTEEAWQKVWHKGKNPNNNHKLSSVLWRFLWFLWQGWFVYVLIWYHCTENLHFGSLFLWYARSVLVSGANGGDKKPTSKQSWFSVTCSSQRVKVVLQLFLRKKKKKKKSLLTLTKALHPPFINFLYILNIFYKRICVQKKYTLFPKCTESYVHLNT